MYPQEYDGATVKAWAGSSQFRAWRADLARYRKWGYTGWGSEGFWALTVYRAQRGLLPHKSKWWAKAPSVGLSIAKKVLTVVTHINLEAGADIGPGLLIPHSGPVRVHAEAKIGADCALHHVVTIGAGTRPGAAQIGDHVLVGCHAAILGPVRIGDRAMVGSSSLVLSDVPANATALGVPARVITPVREKAAPVSIAPRANNTPALVHGDAIAPSGRNAFAALAEQARERPHKTAITYVGSADEVEQRSFAAWHDEASRAITFLRSELADDEPVLIFAPRTPACLSLMLGAIGDGRTFSSLNPRWRWPQIRRVLDMTGARHLFTDADGRAAIERVSTREERADLVFVDLADRALFAAVGAKDARFCPRAEHVACVLFTSGSTGEPKGVCVSETDLAARGEAEASWYGLSGRDVLLHLLPFSFDVGLNQIQAALFAGAEVVVSESWLPADLLEIASLHGVTGIPCVPSIWQDFIHLELAFDTRKAHQNLRFITLSGGDLPPAQLADLCNVLPGVQIFKTYGQTEAFRGASLRPEEFGGHRNSVGRPFPGVTLAIARKDGSLAVRNEVGELVHAGLGMMLGYLGETRLHDEKVRPAPFDPTVMAVFSGDNAFIDDDGFLHVVGREDQMLKLNDNRLYPSEVRNTLCELPGVHDAIVLAERTRAGEAVLFAFVTTRHDISEAELKRAARDHMPGYMVPRHLVLCDALPRTAAGKPDTEALRPRARALLEARPSVGEEASSPLPYLVDVVEQNIVSFIKGRVNARFDPHVSSLEGLLDSLTLIELTQALEHDLGLRVAIARLNSRALESTHALAAAVLNDARPRMSLLPPRVA